MKLKIGDTLELGDFIGKKYKQTRYYDLNIENPIEICKYDENDFKYIQLLPSKKTDINELPRLLTVHKLLSKFRDKIKNLKFSSDRLIATTNFFKIDVQKAIDNYEIKTIENYGEVKKQEMEIDLIEEIQEYYELYSLGLITIEELNRGLEDKNHFYFQFQSKWKTTYAQSITGKFYKKKK